MNHLNDVRAELWRIQYSRQRYLEKCSLQDLISRLSDISYNLLSFSDAGFPVSDCAPRTLWLRERAIHVHHELELRRVPETGEGQFPESLQQQYPNIQRALHVWHDRTIPAHQYFVKYGKHPELLKVLEKGLITVRPASDYDDPSLNPAVRDKELEAVISFPPGTGLRRQNDQGQYEDLPITGRIQARTRSPTDFYVFCTSATYQHRLFDDFNADACLLVHEPKVFVRKMVDALNRHYPNWLFGEKMVSYYDPLWFHGFAEIPFAKHFRYWYQNEYRVVVKPQPPVLRLSPIALDLGKISDLCQLIVL